MDAAVAERLGPAVQRAETRAFFAPRAATWEQRFPDDDPAYAAAVAELDLRPGETAMDAGCGTGRALPHLRAAVGPTGLVLGFDLTPEMLASRLVLFHPSGRAALAARHGRRLREDDLLAPDPLRRLLQRTGWWLARYDDGPDRFLAVAERVSP
jgi:SAM-dependent methyltransferase